MKETIASTDDSISASPSMKLSMHDGGFGDEEVETDPMLDLEEKKEDSNTVASQSDHSRNDDLEPTKAKGAEGNDEEGQEALWLDEEQNPTAKAAEESPETGGGESKKSGRGLARIFLWSPSRSADNKAAAAKQQASEPEDLHAKALAARKLLDQSFDLSSTQSNREELARSAFREAIAASTLYHENKEEPISTELKKSLDDAFAKGEAAAAKARELLGELGRIEGEARDASQDEVETGNDETAESLKASAHYCASKARQYLDFILAEAGVEPEDSPSEETPVEDGQGTIAPELDRALGPSSPGSDNDILDESMEVPSAAESSQETREEHESENIGSNEESTTQAGSRSVSAKSSPTRKGLFGFFRNKGSRDGGNAPRKETPKIEPNEPETAEKIISLGDIGGEYAPDPSGIVQRFVASVHQVEEEDVPMPPSERELERLKRYADVDGRVDQRLREAMLHDPTESIFSVNGVRMHGFQSLKVDKENKHKNKSQEIVDESISKTRDPEYMRPQFLAAYKGDPAELLQRSWESLIEAGAVAQSDLPNAADGDDDVEGEESVFTEVSDT